MSKVHFHEQIKELRADNKALMRVKTLASTYLLGSSTLWNRNQEEEIREKIIAKAADLVVNHAKDVAADLLNR